jgi:hypothetical protein
VGIYYYQDNIMDYEIDCMYSTHRIMQNGIFVLMKGPELNIHLRDISVDGKIILKKVIILKSLRVCTEVTTS